MYIYIYRERDKESVMSIYRLEIFSNNDNRKIIIIQKKRYFHEKQHHWGVVLGKKGGEGENREIGYPWRQNFKHRKGRVLRWWQKKRDQLPKKSTVFLTYLCCVLPQVTNMRYLPEPKWSTPEQNKCCATERKNEVSKNQNTYGCGCVYHQSWNIGCPRLCQDVYRP